MMLTYQHRDPATNARVVIDTPTHLSDAQVETVARMAYTRLGNARSFSEAGKNAAGRWLVMAFA